MQQERSGKEDWGNDPEQGELREELAEKLRSAMNKHSQHAGHGKRKKRSGKRNDEKRNIRIGILFDTRVDILQEILALRFWLRTKQNEHERSNL